MLKVLALILSVRILFFMLLRAQVVCLFGSGITQFMSQLKHLEIDLELNLRLKQ